MGRRAAIIAVALSIGGAPRADAPRTIVDLQPFRHVQSTAIRTADGRAGVATLVDLNPTIGAWYVLTLTGDRAPARSYHLENPRPRAQTVVIDSRSTAGVGIAERDGRRACEPCGVDSLDAAAASAAPFAPACGGRLYVRNHASGRHTELESAVDVVREHVPGGERLLELGHDLLGDQYLDRGRIGDTAARDPLRSGPLPALVDPDAAARALSSDRLGITLVGAANGLRPGAWYAVTGHPGVYVSLVQPGTIAGPILHDGAASVSALDSVEASAIAYLVAFDLDRFELGYAGGTEHPSVGWSAHMPSAMRDAAEPGPDGIASIAPLVATGIVSPWDAPRTVATFAGGFKRQHGAFLYGDLATRNHASHYGFLEHGVVLSTLQPGLATLIVSASGAVEMKTWTPADADRVRDIRHARQNGVAIVEYDAARHTTVPGALVNRWGPGNWSGSSDMKLRTIRGAAAIQHNGGEHYLIYAVFSAATPSAMARVFQAYRCEYAMLLDMNALEHTYFALIDRDASGIRLQYLIKGMSQVDRVVNGRVVPRFVGEPDNRDFFYVMTRP